MEVKKQVPFGCQDTVLSYAVSPKMCREECENAMGVLGRDFDGKVLPWRVFVYISPGELEEGDLFAVKKASGYVGVGYVFRDDGQAVRAEKWFEGYVERKVEVVVDPAVGYAKRKGGRG